MNNDPDLSQPSALKHVPTTASDTGPSAPTDGTTTPTPRTDAFDPQKAGLASWRGQGGLLTHARTLERELALTEKRLGEAQGEVEQLREVAVNGAGAKCLDDLRAQLATSQARLVEVEKERDDLAAWKASAMEVERTWDAQIVGRLLDLPLGTAIRPRIEPGIRALKVKLAAMESALAQTKGQLDAVKAALDFDISGDTSVETTARRLYHSVATLATEKQKLFQLVQSWGMLHNTPPLLVGDEWKAAFESVFKETCEVLASPAPRA